MDRRGKLNIVFICDVAQIGKSGVGDYTFLLAKACAQKGHSCALLALNDAYVEKGESSEEVLDSGMPVFRLKSIRLLKKYQSVVLKWIQKQRPSWISLQFVPYIYSLKGLPNSALIRFLKKLPAVDRHIMVHEIWIGAHQEASFKHRLLGIVQRAFMRWLFKAYKPTVTHTQCVVHFELLHAYGFKCELLPLFGNLPIKVGLNVDHFYKLMEDANVPLSKESRGDFWLFATFGRLYSKFNYLKAVESLIQASELNKKRFVLLVLGQLGETETAFKAIQHAEGRRCIRMDKLTTEELSLVVQHIDFGIATTPYALIDKSSGAASMADLGVPVLVPRDDVSFGSIRSEFFTTNPLFYKMSSDLLKQLVSLKPRACKDSLNQVSRQFLSVLQQASSS